MRITIKHLEAKVDTINNMLGHDYEHRRYNSVGSVHLYQAYGAYGVHRICNEHGGVTSLMEMGSARETAQFLSGMIAALRITNKVDA